MCRFADEFARLDTDVLIVSFGLEWQARVWLRETGVSFPLLLDQDRRVYQAYGLARSALRAWAPRVIWYYARQFAAGRRLHRIEGDPHQLGGDFIVDRAGTVRFAHPERDPVDRPQAADLLDVLRGLPRGEQAGESSGP